MNGIVAGRRVHVAAGSESLISSSGLSLLAQTASVSGLAEELSAGLSRWRIPAAVQDPGKIVLDLVLAIARRHGAVDQAATLRTGKATASSAADRIAVLDAALATRSGFRRHPIKLTEGRFGPNT